MKLDLLAIAPHPDDVELTCGGTMLRMAQEGYATGILDLTRGETGTRGTPETRLKESARAGKLLGAKVRRNLGLPDAHLRVCDEYKAAIAEVIREFEPRTVILPYWEGRHPDHYTAATLGYEACFVAGLKSIRWPERLGGHSRSFTPRRMRTCAPRLPLISPSSSKGGNARSSPTNRFQPTKREKTKVSLPLDQLEGRMDLLARHFGRMIGVKYAEGLS